MPVIKSAIKKLRKDRKQEVVNQALRKTLKQTVKKAQKDKSQKTLSLAFSVIDKARKNNLIHKNKANRLKAALSRVSTSVKPTTEKAVKKAVPKKTAVRVQSKDRPVKASITT